MSKVLAHVTLSVLVVITILSHTTYYESALIPLTRYFALAVFLSDEFWHVCHQLRYVSKYWHIRGRFD